MDDIGDSCVGAVVGDSEASGPERSNWRSGGGVAVAIGQARSGWSDGDGDRVDDGEATTCSTCC